MPFGLLQLVEVGTCTCDVPLVAFGRRGRLVFDVYAAQLVLLLQVEVGVYGNALVVFVGQQGEQALGIHGFGAWLIQVQVVQPLFKERSQYLVFFHEKRGLCHQCQFHLSDYGLLIGVFSWQIQIPSGSARRSQRTCAGR